MEYLSRNDLETIAARITADYQHLPRFQGQQVHRIDPEVLACELCGLTIAHYHLSPDRSILGMTAHCEIGVEVYDAKDKPVVYPLDGRTILIEQSLKNEPAQQGRYHFTVMHEAAHQILARLFPHTHRAIQNRVLSYRGQVSHSPIQDWGEWQADNLASALLLPVGVVWSALQHFGFPNGIDLLNKIYRPREYERFCCLAESLGASKQALAIRLKRLGWLKQDYFQNPYTLVDIEKEDDESWPTL